jgi:hypothetical protein
MRATFTSSAMDSIGRRLESSLQSWEPQLAWDFRLYASAQSRPRARRGRQQTPEVEQPYWLLLPQWLARNWRRSGKAQGLDRRSVEDILWGQYCLFLWLKIHDDIFDEQTHRISLIYAGDAFLVKACEVFSHCFETSSPFWRFFYSSLDETLSTIDAMDRHERSGRLQGLRSLSLIAKEYAMCKIASYAICLKAGREHDFPRVARFADEMAIMGQTIDDLQDMEKDLERGRINPAASCLLGPGRNGQRPGPQTLHRIAENLRNTDVSTRLFSALRRRVDRAARAIAPLGIPEAEAFLRSCRVHLERMEDRFHRERVKLIFGPYATMNISKG